MSTHENQVKTSNTTSHAAIDLCCETIMVGVGFPTAELVRTTPLEGAGLPQLRSDLRELRGVLGQTGSLAAPAASEEDNNRFSMAHARLTESFDGLARRVVNLAESLQGSPITPIISRADSTRYDRTLRDHSREASRIIKAANTELGELREITEAGHAVSIGEGMLALIRTAARVAKERIVTTLEGVRSEMRHRQRDARRTERTLSAERGGFLIADIAPGTFQITTLLSSFGLPSDTGRKSDQSAKDIARAGFRRELGDVIAARETIERSKKSELALRAMNFLNRLDTVCEGGIVFAIVTGRILDVVPFIGNRRIERRIADHAVTLASHAKREEELTVMLGDSPYLSA